MLPHTCLAATFFAMLLKETTILGIDPGLKGGFALLGLDSPVLYPMPKTLMEVADWLERYNPSYVYLEKGQCFPKNGAAGMFNYGKHCGELVGLLTMAKIPFEEVTPAVWTRAMYGGVRGGDPKVKAKIAVSRIFPHLDLIPEGCRTPHKGLIDALLIAEYGRRDYMGPKAA